VVYRLAATHAKSVRNLTAIESGLAGFGAERLADINSGGVWYIGALAALGVAELLFEKQARAFIGDYLYALYGVAPMAVGSRGGAFTHAAFRSVTPRKVTALQLDGVGHYVAQEAPQLLAEILLEAFAANTG
jgi:hypothetical protein